MAKAFSDFQEYAQLLLASRIFNDYLEVKAVLFAARKLEEQHDRKRSSFPTANPEPETYVTDWVKEYVTGGDTDWKAAVSGYFLALVCNYPNARKTKEND